ncbi:major histocompatibility complex class I-related gene protein-like isoform 2-T3 [Liasis olivaceus]
MADFLWSMKHVEEFSGTRKRAQEKEPASRISTSSSSFLTAEGLFSGAPPGPFPPFSHEGTGSHPSPARGSGSLQAGSALRLLLLLVFSALLLEDCSASSSSSWHSLYYSYTFVSEPSQGLPRFSILESLDDQPIARYDSNTQEYRSLAPWMEEVKKQEPLWEEYAGIARKAEQDFGRNLATLQKYYNCSEGFHTLQWRYGCEQNGYSELRGSDQDGYDGRTYISFDKRTLSWTAYDGAVQLSKRKLEGDPSVAKHLKYYLEETCTEMLRNRLTYGKEALLRTEPPAVKVMAEAEFGFMETHICQLHGFFPKEIKATWRKDGEVWQQDTSHGFVAPNSDGTYHFWISIRINRSDRNHFQCHVEHDGLQKPLNVVLQMPGVHQGDITIIVLIALMAAVLFAVSACLELYFASIAITFCLLLLNVFLAALLYYLPLEPRWEFMAFWLLLAIGLVLVMARFIQWFRWITKRTCKRRCGE